MRASKLFCDEDRCRIEQAVAAAESQTSCEIVPVVATTSDQYERSQDIIGLWFAIASAVVFWLCFPRVSQADSGWDATPNYLPAGLMAVIMLVSFVLGVFLGAQIAGLKRLFTPQVAARKRVSDRARQVFFDRRVHHTASSTGILIYISLFERMAVVLADEAVLEAVGQGTLDEMCKQLTSGFRKGDGPRSLERVITDVGNRLAPLLPREKNDTDELSNLLVIID